MKRNIITILFLLWAWITGVWATQEILPIPETLAPLRVEQLPKLTPRRPLVTCLWGEPTDNPPLRPPLSTQEPLLLNQDGSGIVVSRLGENPPLTLTEPPTPSGRYLNDISNNTFSQEFSTVKDNILSDQGSISSPLTRNEGAIVDRWQGGTSSQPAYSREHIVNGWKDEATSKIPSREGRIQQGRVIDRWEGENPSRPLPKEGSQVLEKTQKTEKLMPQRDLKAGTEAISKKAPKNMEKNIEKGMPKVEKKIQTSKKISPKETTVRKTSFKKPVVKKTVKSSHHPKKVTQTVPQKNIPHKSYLKDLKKKYDEGFAEGQKHPDCSMCKLPEYLR